VPRKTDARSDAELVEASKRGEVDAFEVLYDRHRDRVAAWAERFTSHPEEALEVFQDTFTYLLEKLPTLQLSGRLTTFLYPVVRSLASQAGRERRRRETLGCILHPYVGSLAAEARTPLERRESLAKVIEKLPSTQREVLLMRFVDGMRLSEIARALGIPVGTVKSRLFHALETLRSDPRSRGELEDVHVSPCF